MVHAPDRRQTAGAVLRLSFGPLALGFPLRVLSILEQRARAVGYLEWLCGALLVPQPVFIILAAVFLLTEQPITITEQHPNPDYDIRKLY